MTQYEMLVEIKKILELPDEEQVKAFYKFIIDMSEIIKPLLEQKEN